MEPFVALMRRYCFDYTNRQDFSVCREIIHPEYQLHMGAHRLVGREEQYIPAARIQFEQFPHLTLTVHEIVTNGDRLAMRFSEHGASTAHDGRQAAWGGIGLYRWDGQQLTENFVEQDYLSRRRQLRSSSPHPVARPAVDPWATPALPEDPETLRTAREWLQSGRLEAVELMLDDCWVTGGIDLSVEPEEVVVDTLFTAGVRAAFHAGVYGTYRGDLENVDRRAARRCVLHLAGLATVEAGTVTRVDAISDRLGLRRRLRDTSADG